MANICTKYEDFFWNREEIIVFKNKWHVVKDIAPDSDFEKQLQIVDNNEMGIFWG
jgi:hypothetical protein